MIPEAVPEMDSARYFFSILVFLIIILEMAKYFFNLTLLSCANPSDATYEGVATVHLA
jgi:hypothetical protein